MSFHVAVMLHPVPLVSGGFRWTPANPCDMICDMSDAVSNESIWERSGETSLACLTPGQTRMLAILDDGLDKDSVGPELGDLKGWQFAAVDALVAKGLVKPYSGWRWTFWFRLTPEGRHMAQENRTV